MARREPIHSPTTLLLRFPNWLGDAVMAQPLLSLLRQHHPATRLLLLAPKGVGALFSHDPHVDEILPLSRGEEFSLLQKRIKGAGAEVGILTTNSFSSAWLFWRAALPVRIGFRRDGRSLLLSHPLSPPPPEKLEHQVLLYQRLLAPLGIEATHSPAPHLYLAPEEIAEAQKTLRAHGVVPGEPLVLLNPSAAFGPAKCWPPERYHALMAALNQRKIWTLVLGDQQSEPMISQLIEGLGSYTFSLAGKTNLRQLMALLSCASVVVSNDSGPMHLTAALGRPLVALFGSTSPERTGPFTSKATLLRHSTPCGPCYLRTCPLDFRCMIGLSVQRVLEATLAYFGS